MAIISSIICHCGRFLGYLTEKVTRELHFGQNQLTLPQNRVKWDGVPKAPNP